MRYFYLLTVLLILLLAACNGVDDGQFRTVDGTPDPTQPKVIWVTDTETGVFEVNYPPDWVAQAGDEGDIGIANSGSALRAYGLDVTELLQDHLAGTMSVFHKEAMPETLEQSPEGLLSWVRARITDPGADRVRYTFGETTRTTINGRGVAIADALGTEDDVALDLRVMIVELDDVYGVMLFNAPAFMMENYHDDLDQLAASITFYTVDEWEALGDG